MEFLSVLVTLAVLCAVFFFSYYTSRFIGKRAKNTQKGKYMQVVDKLALGMDKSIALVQVGRGHMLVGMSRNNIELLWASRDAEMPEIPQDAQNKGDSFLARFLSALDEKRRSSGR